MKTQARFQRGFGAVEGLLIVVIVAGLCFVTWYVMRSGYNAKDDYGKNNSTVSQATKTYTDTAKVYSLEYPAGWTVGYPADGHDGAVLTPDWAKTSRPIFIKPGGGHSDVMVQTGCDQFSIAKIKSQKDKFHTQADVKLHGYTALADKLDFKGDAESYVTWAYAFEHNGQCLYINYQVSHHHPMSNTDFDDSNNLSAFDKIIKSVRFLD